MAGYGTARAKVYTSTLRCDIAAALLDAGNDAGLAAVDGLAPERLRPFFSENVNVETQVQPDYAADAGAA